MFQNVCVDSLNDSYHFRTVNLQDGNVFKLM